VIEKVTGNCAAAERSSWVARQTEGSAALRSAVERLLANVDAERDFLTPPTSPGAIARAFAGPLPQPGTRIGAYVLGHMIGTGGMGSVYLAHQERPSRNVALKLMRPGSLTAEAVRRFELEGEFLGRLRHPGIATIFELGTYAAAGERGDMPVPFLAMEFVEGAHDIVTHAREAGLGLRARIALFGDVCDAVQHAHRMGVIHRDLKPGNVLVDSSGRAKVIDFGVARVITPGIETDAGPDGQAFGTLQYASPEQVSGAWQDVDVRTDVYALGAILYELLAEHRYMDVADKPLVEVIRDVCERHPQPPSEHARGLARELDWIVLKCLRKDREERYGSVAELAADLERFGRDEPLAAGPASASYRARKFIARHRIGAVAALLVLLSLIGGLVGTSLALGRARRQQTRANEAVRRQTSVVDALQRILGAVAPDQDGRKVTLYELLERERTRLDDELTQDPGLRAALQSFLGAAYDSLGLKTESDELLTSAVATLGALPDSDPDQLAWLRLMLAKNRANQSRFAEARVLLEASLPRLESGGERHSAKLVTGLRLQAQILALEGNQVESAAAYRKLVPLAEKVLGPEHVDTIMAMSQLAKQLSMLRDRQQALEWAQRAHASAQRSVGAQHPLTLFTAMNLGEALRARGQLAEATKVLSAVLSGSAETYGEHHPNTIHAKEVLAWALIDAGELEQAQALAREALEAVLTHQAGVLDLELWARICQADVFGAVGDPAGSAEHLNAALARLDAAQMPDHPAHFRLRWDLAVLDFAAGRLEGSERLLLREEQLALQSPDTESIRLAVARGLHGRALQAQGRVDEARAELLACQRVMRNSSDARLAALTDDALDTLVEVCVLLGAQDESLRIERILNSTQQTTTSR
jgi:non-specific serine/threonine protein kinase/serine/threonine-protein kinase